MTQEDERIGFELPWVYPGVSAWLEPDGTYTNCWTEHADTDEGKRLRDLTQEWIDRVVAGAAAFG